MTHLDLFSGIGGFSLAARWCGIETIGFSEIDPYCCRVLAKNFPGVPNFGDIRNITKDTIDSAVNLGHITNDMDPKYNEAASLYKSGFSIGEIAEFFNVSRQAMWKILQRRGVEFRDNTRSGADNHFWRGSMLANKRVGHIVELAIEKKILVRKPCEVCGDFRSSAHHDNYNEPLNVRWLCRKHHYEWHKTNKAMPLTTTLPKMSQHDIASLGGKAGCASRWNKNGNKHNQGTPARGVGILTAGVP